MKSNTYGSLVACLTRLLADSHSFINLTDPSKWT